MRRRVFTLAAAVSAVLCAGIVLLWIRSEVLQGPKYLELTEATDATSTRIKQSEGRRQALSTRVVPPDLTTAEREEREERRQREFVWENDERRKLFEQRSRLQSQRDQIAYHPSRWIS